MIILYTATHFFYCEVLNPDAVAWLTLGSMRILSLSLYIYEDAIINKYGIYYVYIYIYIYS